MLRRLRATMGALLFSAILFACGGNESEGGGIEPSPVDTSTLDTSAEDATAEMGPVTAPEEKLNLNTATREDFLAIPGVGDRMVGEFLEYRPYVSIQQFRREIGKYVDADQVAAYEEHVFVPIDPNESDAETLMQIPELDPGEADALIAGRPYESTEAFLEAVRTYVSDAGVAAAEAFVAR